MQKLVHLSKWWHVMENIDFELLQTTPYNSNSQLWIILEIRVWKTFRQSPMWRNAGYIPFGILAHSLSLLLKLEHIRDLHHWPMWIFISFRWSIIKSFYLVNTLVAVIQKIQKIDICHQSLAGFIINQTLCKVNSVQEACPKCSAVYTSKFEILQITWKKEIKNIRLLVFSFSPKKIIFIVFVLFFQFLICESQHKGFGTSFLYWVDFNYVHEIMSNRKQSQLWTIYLESTYSYNN